MTQWPDTGRQLWLTFWSCLPVAPRASPRGLPSALGNSMLLPETVVGFTCLNAVRYFFMMHFGFEGGCGDIHLGTSCICFCMDLTRVEACWVLTTCPDRSAKNSYPVSRRFHLRQDAEDVQRNDFISKLFAKIEGTPKHT